MSASKAVTGIETWSCRLHLSSHVLPTIRSNVRRGFGYKRIHSSIDKPPRLGLGEISQVDSIPSPSSPLRFTFTAAVCETVPQGSSSPLCSTESSAQAEFSREGSNIEGGTSLESSVPFEPLFAPLRSSSFDSQFNRTVGLDCSMIKIH